MGYGLTYTPYNTNLFLDARGINPDAAAFITAAGITDPTQISAINTLVNGLQADGLWTKMKAIYPFVGGTATTHKYNLKDPRDLDAAFRLVFNGGWTHSSTGATPNGTNGYADTKLNPLSVLTQDSTHLSFYSRTNALNPAGSPHSMGASNALTLFRMVMARFDNFAAYESNTGGLLWDVATTTLGYFNTTRTASNLSKVYRNGTTLTTKTTASNGTVNLPMYIGARNDSGLVNGYDTKQCAFSSIGDSLSDTEASNLYTRVQTYQTALSRQV